MQRTLVLIAAALAAPLARPLPAVIPQPVKVTGGLVSGFPGKDPNIVVFKAVPFAAPPTGDRRWRAPAPVGPWKGVRSSEKFSASCMQNITQERQPWTYEFMTHNEISEDCLYLNVWTAAKSPAEKRPVFLYIYGGGFNEGSAAVPVYDGEGLAKKGLVVVTINYRVNIMGFFVHPELSRESENKVSGNYGLLDQIAALQWVKANIASFGGDPNRVTIAGQSAGGMSVHDLIASPLARGLFQRAIVESGGSTVGRAGINLTAATLANAEAAGQRFAEAKGATSLAALRAMDWQKLIEPVPQAQGATASGGRGGRGPSATGAPIVDGYVLPVSASQALAQGTQNDVPILTGMNTGELGGLVPGRGAVTLESFRQQAQQRYGSEAERFLALYPATNDQEAVAAQAQANRDQTLVSMYLWARGRSKTSKTKSFLYLFDHALPGPEAARFGAFHTGEVPYVLNTLYASPRPFTDDDRKVADRMSSYWANFAAKGDPNGKDLPAWPAWSEEPVVMELGDRNGPIPAADSRDKLAFFEAFLTRP